MMKNRALSGQLFANAGYFIFRISLAMIIRFSSPAKEKEGMGGVLGVWFTGFMAHLTMPCGLLA